jgi:hypothetical protein
MKSIGLGLVLVLVGSTVGSAASNEAVWRWSDTGGTLHYSNLPDRIPAQAEEVKTRIGHAVTSLPDASIEDIKDGDEARTDRGPNVFPHRVRKRLHPTYDRTRLHFGCWASSVLYYGGWSHPDDIAPYYGCVPFQVGGPDAWLHAAKAELAIREHGLDLREMVNVYRHNMKAAHATNLAADEESGPVRALSYSPEDALE